MKSDTRDERHRLPTRTSSGEAFSPCTHRNVVIDQPTGGLTTLIFSRPSIFFGHRLAHPMRAKGG
jgi:hypothetical protein